MIIRYIDKPLDRMSIDELHAERHVQTWIKERVRRERRDLAYQIKKKEEYLENNVPSWEELDALRDQKKITPAESRVLRSSRRKKERQIVEWNERLAFADMWLLHMNAFLERIDDKINWRKYGREIHKGTRKRKGDVL